MNDKIARLKNVYKREVAELLSKVENRQILLSFILDEIKRELGEKSKEITVHQMQATQKLVDFITAKKAILKEIPGSINEKENLSHQLTEVDKFLTHYPFISAKFDEVVNSESAEDLKNAVLSFINEITPSDQKSDCDTKSDFETEGASLKL